MYNPLAIKTRDGDQGVKMSDMNSLSSRLEALFLPKRHQKKIARERKKAEQAARTAPSPVPETAQYTTKLRGLIGDKTVKLLYWPSYTNPYQRLFYGHPNEWFDHSAGTIDAALDQLKSSENETVVFHVHWLNFLEPSETSPDYGTNCQQFIKKCATFRDLGGLLFWTVHNLMEHDTPDAAIETDLRLKLLELSHAVFVHSEAAKEAIALQSMSPTDNIHTIEHGNYIGVYPDAVSQDVARGKLGLKNSTTVFLNLGLIRRYKGLDALVSQVDRLAEDGRDCVLLLAGRKTVADAGMLGELSTTSTNLISYDGWIADWEIQNYMNASDFMVVPYKQALTSGSAMLALSFALPVVAPALGNLPDLIKDGVNGFLYDPDDANGLAKSLRRATDTSNHELAEMRYNALVSAQNFSWLSARSVLLRKISSLS
ncbi:glycosyltransferase family 4 protein [Litoreibacter roseus]|uniref:Uncharacterized protein n=1 Tax=Litoreibacter roseus TaxID=2601869 RepID=A0A6N6JLD2_9RHOB|nr:glycosyltransferase family 4 protein [Litoreibacter roseus]GFE66219.1 hypothetical protein KIN_32930 [Litoreibacter roseus]